MTALLASGVMEYRHREIWTFGMVRRRIVGNDWNMKVSFERRRKSGSDLVLILMNFRNGFRGDFARTVWLSRRHLFRNIFRDYFRGRMPVNDGAHEY